MNDLHTLLRVRDTLFEEVSATREGRLVLQGLNRALAMVSDLIQEELDDMEKQSEDNNG